MSIFKKPVAPVTATVDQAIVAMQKQVEDLHNMEDNLHDEIDTQRSIIQAAQNRVAISQAEITKSEAIRKTLSAAIQSVK